MQAEFFRQCHVDGDVGGGGAGEEGVESAFAQAGEDQSVRVLAGLRPDDERVHDEGDKCHAAEQDCQQASVAEEGGKAGFGDGLGDQSENTQGGETDNPLYDGSNGVGEVGDDLAGGVGAVVAQCGA